MPDAAFSPYYDVFMPLRHFHYFRHYCRHYAAYADAFADAAAFHDTRALRPFSLTLSLLSPPPRATRAMMPLVTPHAIIFAT